MQPRVDILVSQSPPGNLPGSQNSSSTSQPANSVRSICGFHSVLSVFDFMLENYDYVFVTFLVVYLFIFQRKSERPVSEVVSDTAVGAPGLGFD